MSTTLNLGPSILCRGCKNMRQYPNGFRKGLCMLCFPRSIDDRHCSITITDILKMFFTRDRSFLRCDDSIINFLKTVLETYHFPKLNKTIPKGYQLDISADGWDDYNPQGEKINSTWEGAIHILKPDACNPGIDVPLVSFKVDKHYNIL